MPVAFLGPTPDFSSTVKNGADYLLGVYPIADNNFASPITLPTYFSFNLTSQIPFYGALYDATQIWLESKLSARSLDQSERTVAIVSENYLQYHFFAFGSEGGIHFNLPFDFAPISNVVFVQTGMMSRSHTNSDTRMG